MYVALPREDLVSLLQLAVEMGLARPRQFRGCDPREVSKGQSYSTAFSGQQPYLKVLKKPRFISFG